MNLGFKVLPPWHKRAPEKTRMLGRKSRAKGRPLGGMHASACQRQEAVEEPMSLVDCSIELVESINLEENTAKICAKKKLTPSKNMCKEEAHSKEANLVIMYFEDLCF
ncbi:hypothetical protein SASPL_102188 [Salvia splendens]|uniref:Uncharacterized protein n=1 Tax=Salvia splendens TaxID=180675 RepID=A0A8X8YT66_SALSN|nr:hypothetical protein SASPL_102188 [Salvia splendens]